MKISGTILWRALCNLLLFLSIFWMPPLFSLFSGAALLFFFPRFYEFFIIAFLVDVLYGVPVPLFGGFPLVFSSLALALFVLSEGVKRRMRFY